MSFLEESKHLRVPSQEIQSVTKNYSTVIGRGGYGVVYKGELSLTGIPYIVAVKRLDSNISGQGIKEFLTEIQLLSRYKHPNLISLLGFCDEGSEKVLIYEYAEHGSLDMYLRRDETVSPLTWKQRLNICADVARGLDYLHNHVADHERVIHRDIKSANILIDRNWKAMLADFGLSTIGRANENDTYVITNVSGTHVYCDPSYINTGILTKKSDVYSFGVVLFEVLCGRLCFMNVNNEHRFLPQLAKRYYKEKRLHEIIDPDLKNHVDSFSMNCFSEIAYQCLEDDRKGRPSFGFVLQKLEKALLDLIVAEEREALKVVLKPVRIPFQEILIATKNYTTVIGRGGYGVVYKGELSLTGIPNIVAVKRLLHNNITGQSFKEFLKEILLLSRFKHPNLISLLGFCEEGSEKVLIYEYAEHGSLDMYLRRDETVSPLTWKQRLNICVDAARGLDCLHNNVAEKKSVIHRDIKSANILIDRNWNAMIADLGHSKIDRANENDTFLITNASGTQGYCDPSYVYTGILTKESDVYSFGVVLFEVLCGRLWFMNVNNKHRFLPQLAKRYYKKKRLHEIIDPDLKNHVDSDHMKDFSEIAYQCLEDDRKRRPSIGFVLQKLEKALDLIVAEEREALELQERESAMVIQMTYRVHLIKRSQAVRALCQLAVAKGTLKELMTSFNNRSYRHWVARDAEEKQKFSERIILLLLTIDAIEGPNIMVRAAKRSVVDDLEAMMDVVDPQPGGGQSLSLKRRTFNMPDGVFQKELAEGVPQVVHMLGQENLDGSETFETCFLALERKQWREELSPQDAAIMIQMTFRAYLIKRSQAFRALRELAVAKGKLQELRTFFNNFSYRQRVARDAEEKQCFSERIIVVLLTVDTIEGSDIMVRAAKRSMMDELEAMLEVVDPSPGGGRSPFLKRRTFNMPDSLIKRN